MQPTVAPCGIICSECDAYKATEAKDADAIATVAAEWSQRYRRAFSPDDIPCDGCLAASERRARFTDECPIRPCALERGIATCAECVDYPCDHLTRVHQLAPQARQTLESLRRGETLES